MAKTKKPKQKPVKEVTSLAVREAVPAIAQTAEQVELIKKTIAKGATDDELKLFLYTAKKTGLDPLARQFYFIKRKQWNQRLNGYEEKASMQASIDGLRVVAQRSGAYAGQDEPKFEHKTTGGKEWPIKCTVTVYKFARDGQRYPAAIGVAYWEEYCPKPPGDMMWQKMPHTMLSKVAEALALRKAFPQDLSGIYTQEEMAQAEPKAVNLQIPPADFEEGGNTVHVLEPTAVDEEDPFKGRQFDQPGYEDIPVIDGQNTNKPVQPVAQELVCSKCANGISVAERGYSEKVFKKVLCRNCQNQLRTKR